MINTTTIDISPQTITANTTGLSLCNGAVTASVPTGFASYQWFNNGLQVFGGSSPTYVVNNAGNYHCEVIYPTGCTAVSNTLAKANNFNLDIRASKAFKAVLIAIIIANIFAIFSI